MFTSSTPKLLPFRYVLSGAIVAWIAAWLFGGKSTLVCNRGSDRPQQCQVEDLNLFGKERSQTIPLKDIKKVDVIADSDEEEPSAILVLVTANEQVAIGTSGAFEDKDRLASQVAWFLEDPKATTFNLTDGNQTLSWCLFGISTALLINYLYQLMRSKSDRSA
jgi:hypothetical protein